MTNIYDVFNTSSEHEFSKFFNKLELNTNELLNVTTIAENNILPLSNKRQKILEIMAGSADGNYELCLEQFNKIKKERLLKESSLNLNQVMELNNLVVDVSKKIKSPKCMQGVFNIIKTKSNANVANTFLGMVQQSQVNDSNLKFNTELQVNGQNLAQIIYQMKNDIEMFINSFECPTEKKENKKEDNKKSEEINEEKIRKAIPLEQTISSIKTWVDSVHKPSALEELIKMIDEYKAVAKNTIQINTLEHLKSIAQTRLNQMNNGKPKIEECIAQQVVSDVCDENTFDGLLNNMKPTVINITVNKETGDIEELPTAELCLEPCDNCNNINYPTSVQPMNISPTAIDAPILKKPDQASAISALSALSSHMNCVKSDSRENNIEELQTINTLLSQLSNYFNSVLNESVNNDLESSEYKKIKYISDAVDIYKMASFNTPNKPISDSIVYDYLEESGEEVDRDDSLEINANILDDIIRDENILYRISQKIIKLAYDIDPEVTLANISMTAVNYDNNKKPSKKYNIDDYNVFLGKEISNGQSTYKIIDIFDNFSEVMFKIQNISDENDIILITIKELKQYFNFDVNNYNQESEDYWDGDDEEELNEDTVFDHSWYENDDGDYPERTKNGVIGLPIKEGIKDWFKKDDKKYIIKLGNSGYFCKDGHTIIGDINDAMVITGYNKALKIAQKLNKYEGTSLYTPVEIDENINETCSAGATCSANVSGFAKPLGSKPKKRKKSDTMVEMFKESIQNNIPCSINLNNKTISYRLYDNKGYLFINESIVKANDKKTIIEAVDDIYNDCLSLPIFEGVSHYYIDMLIEEENNMETNTVITPQEKEKQEQELNNELNNNPNLKVGVTDNTSNEIIDNQELVGIDDSDIQNKKYIVKDPMTGKVKVADFSQIKISKDNKA